MPKINLNRDMLFQWLNKTYTDDEFQDLCFAFGIELDEVTTEKQMLKNEQGDVAIADNASEDVIYRIDIPANRYDLLCVQGLVAGLLTFSGEVQPIKFKALLPVSGSPIQMNVLPATNQIRPFAVAAVIRNIQFTDETYKAFIDLQDKLHQNICRKRSLVAIGTHDLDKIQAPFFYDAKAPADIVFRPLNQQKEMNAVELMDFYSTHAQLKAYLPIIRDSPVYPVIYDANGVVLSLPPIINGDHSKITLNTKNVFIECTATDMTKASIVLDTLICMFTDGVKCTAEIVHIVMPDGEVMRYPALAYRTEVISAKTVNSYVGINESGESITKLLKRMGLTASVAADGDTISVSVPPTRHDIIHACDIYEDVAISYGYNKIKKTLPNTVQIGQQFALNKLTEQLREHVAQSGFTESLTFTLCSRDDISTKLNKTIDEIAACHIGNPKTLEFQVCRTTLIPGILKTLSSNKKMPLPMKLFEISDIVVADKDAEVNARNERRICAVNCNKSAGFEVVHGLLDRVMQLLEVPWKRDEGYYLQATDDSAYFPGRCASILYKGVAIGKIGVLHPTVLNAFELNNPCSVVEFTIEPFV